MQVTMDDLRWVRAMRETQHRRPLDMTRACARKLYRLARAIESEGRDCPRNREFLDLVQRVRICCTLDLFIDRVEEALEGMEARQRAGTQIERTVAYFPLVINPLLAFEKGAPGVMLERQRNKIAHLMARHVRMIPPSWGLDATLPQGQFVLEGPAPQPGSLHS